MHNIEIQPEDIDLVIYHKNCTDGFGAAWAAHELLGSKAMYVPAQYDEIGFVFYLENRTIAVLDFSFSEEDIAKIKSNGNKICIIDHHKTAERISHLENTWINSRFSGAVLAWKFFHPNKKIPLFLKYIQDRDLWKWELEGSRDFSIIFQNIPKTFDSYSEFTSNKKIKDAIKSGALLNRYQFNLVKRISSNHYNCKYKKTNIKLVNSSVLQSEIGNYLSTEDTAAAIWYKNYSAKKTIVSLRSKNNLDVSLIAQDFGGGGHKNAAGFSLDIDADVQKLFTQT